MKAVDSTNAVNVQEPMRATPQQHKDAYRAPRLVTLGTAVGLVQGCCGYFRDYQAYETR